MMLPFNLLFLLFIVRRKFGIICRFFYRVKTSREKKQQAAFYQLDLRAVKKYRQKQLLDIKVGIVDAID